MTLSKSWYAMAFFSVLIAVMSLRWTVQPIQLVMEHMAHYLPSLPVPLYLHLFFAPLALALMPFQFWPKLRKARPTLHRTLGYAYGLSVLLGGISAVWLLVGFEGTTFAAAGFAALGIFWIFTTVKAIMSARAKDFAAHRRWMLRSATLTFAAVTLRFIMAPLMASGWTVTETYNITSFGSWVPFLIAMELWMRSRKPI